MASAQKEVREIIEEIGNAWRQGRPIIPLVGVGLSAESGLLTTEQLVRYLAQLRSSIDHAAYLPDQPHQQHLLKERLKSYLTQPLQFVKDYGWPDPCQLLHDLWKWSDHSEQRRAAFVEDEVREQLDVLARVLYPDRVAILAPANEALAGAPPEFPWQPRRSYFWDAVGQWKDLLRHFCAFDRDYAEALFARLHEGKQPGLGHRFLAFLARLLGIRLFLTTAFDSLLEDALHGEGIPYQLFVLDEGRRFPGPEMVREAPSVIKLHGGTHRLLLDERLDHPVERNFLERFRRALPPGLRPLLLVLGCDGKDYRDIDLIERGFLSPPPLRPARKSAPSGCTSRTTCRPPCSGSSIPTPRT
jgi:hypothetical protein